MALSITGDGAISTDNTDPITLSSNNVQGAKVDSAGAFTQSPSEIGSLGIGQTWQDVTGSRTAGVTYTNSTGRPIGVSWSTTVSSATIFGIVDGVSISRITDDPTNNHTFSMIVPNGSTYSVTGAAPNIWAELR